MSAYDIYQPGPHYRLYDASGIYPLMVYPDLVLDSYAEAQQHMSEIAAEGIDTTGAQIAQTHGGYWLARCSECGVLADDDGYAYSDFSDVVAVCAYVNQLMAELNYKKRGPEWFVSHAKQDARCLRHAPDDYVPVEEEVLGGGG